MNKKTQKDYRGFSLVESLITILILSFIMLLVGVTFITLFKASGISTGRIIARDESEYILEVLRRVVRNSRSDPESTNPDIQLYNSMSVRTYDPDTNSTTSAISGVLKTAYSTRLNEGEIGNEIHMHPSDSEKWICIAYFADTNDPENGYILKTSTTLDLNNPAIGHDSCFDSVGNAVEFRNYAVVLNSADVNINNLEIQYANGSLNTYVVVNIDLEPVRWAPGKASNFKPEYSKQTVITTRRFEI